MKIMFGQKRIFYPQYCTLCMWQGFAEAPVRTMRCGRTGCRSSAVKNHARQFKDEREKAGALADYAERMRRYYDCS